MMRRQRGMALIIVLWIIVLLGIMAAGHSKNVHTEVQLAARQVETARARGLAEAAVNHVILEMLGQRLLQPLPTNGTPFPLAVYDDVVTVAVRNASGLVDLNVAAADLLDSTFKACGIEMTDRAALVDAILDWRDGDNLTHLNGLEDGDYAAMGVPWGSRDGAFSSVEELRYLPGISQALFECMSPLVTVHSGRGGIDLESAPPMLVTALSGNIIEPATQDDTESADAARRAVPGNGTYHIYASVGAGVGTVASVEAVVYISRSSKQPYTILEWRDPPRHELPPLPAAEG